MNEDGIFIEDLKTRARIGVNPVERLKFQTVLICIEIPRSMQKAARTDRLEDTVSYWEVSKVVDKVARARPRRLIEHLAGDVGRTVIKIFGVKRVKVSVKKFIVKEARYVGVQVTSVR
jgi:7,8-dihydroneopterin aldolase/epimerase/oxygenase